MKPRLAYGYPSTRVRRDGDFQCIHCHNLVPSAAAWAGVQHRNHCPYCLWSRHVDLYWAGDRLSACKAGMWPVGLTAKQRVDRYGRSIPGELMLIHACVECNGVAINRIAADDHVAILLEIFQRSQDLDRRLVNQLQAGGIAVLDAAEASLVQARLLGTK
ncbi:MAG: RNHCP domain-containing protein [Anaerolineales bacterium]|nr:RNHCP domain-containing protein [Anaerolineales bacterium]